MTEGIDAYAAGVRPGQRRNAAEWFAEHPDAVEQAKRGRELFLSWGQILRFLQDEYAFPFQSADTLRTALDD